LSKLDAIGITGSVPLAVPADDPARGAHLRREQLNLLARQWTRSPFAIAIAIAFIAFLAWPYVPLPLVGAWAITLLSLLFVRRAHVQRVLRAPPLDARRQLGYMVWYALASGLATGAAAPLFFASLPHEERALLTMVLVCLTAGGLATHASYARAFYAYLLTALLPLAAAWGMTGTVINIVVAVQIMVFALFQALFARDNERVVRDSFLIRYENERLLEDLERERHQVLLARDRAEAANHAKSRFLAAASHDLRQPLHTLSLYSAALKLRAADGAVGEIAMHIDKTLASLSTLVDSLLDISKLDAGAVRPEPQRFNLRSLIERIEADYQPVASEKGLAFRVDPATAQVESDPVLLERLIRNLVDNALKHTVMGSVELATKSSGGLVRIAVRDTGPGIPVPERERIFEEFYQIGNPERDRSQGLGLGLAIVRRLARLLDVEVELDTQPGLGSTFVVTLPLASERSAAPSEPDGTNADPGALSGASVLVIDDEPDVRTGMRTLLESWGCRVRACGGLKEAEQVLDGEALNIDVIIADFRLRRRENGIDTVHQLRTRLGGVPALLVTGDTAPERLREAQASGLPLLHKPVPAGKLRQTILAALQR